MTAIDRPAAATDEVLEWIDGLRASGATNMLGATPYIQRRFGFDRDTASSVHVYWMQTFPRDGEKS